MADKNKQPDLGEVLARLGDLEVELAAAKKEVTAAREDLVAMKEELENKDRIIAWLQKKMFGKSSERLDPNQLDLDFDEATLGKPEPPARDWRRRGRSGGGRRKKKKNPPEES